MNPLSHPHPPIPSHTIRANCPLDIFGRLRHVLDVFCCCIIVPPNKHTRSQPAWCSVTEQTDIIRRAWTTPGLCRAEAEPPIHLDYQLLIKEQRFHAVLTTWRKYRATVKCCYRLSEWHSRDHPCKFVCSFSIVGVARGRIQERRKGLG